MLKKPNLSFYAKNAFNNLKGFKIRLMIFNVVPLFLLFITTLGISNIMTHTIITESSNKYQMPT